MLVDPPWPVFLEHDGTGIFFASDDIALSPVHPDQVAHWCRRLMPDCLFDVAYMCHLFPLLMREWCEPEEDKPLIPDAKREPVFHDPLFRGALEETFGVPFYRDQFLRVISLGSGRSIREVSEFLNGKAAPEWDSWREDFVERASQHLGKAYAANLWDHCQTWMGRSRRREWLTVIAEDTLWLAAVRRRHPLLFTKAWNTFNEIQATEATPPTVQGE